MIKQGGYALRFFDTLLRNLLRVVDFLPLFYGVGLTSLLLTRDSQRLGDLVAGTLVVYQEPVETDSLLPDLPAPDESEPPLPAEQLAAIPDEAISLADEYLRSRTELAPRPRQEIAAELVDLIRETSGLEPRPAQSVESFLASVVRQVEQAPPWSSQTPAEAEFPSLINRRAILCSILGELSLGVDHSRTGPAVAVAAQQGISIRNRRHRPD